MPLSTFLHDNQPTQLRGLAFLALSESGWSRHGTVISDGGGGGTTVWVTGGTVPCRIDPLSQLGADEGIVGGRLDPRSTHRVTAAPSLSIATDEQFEIPSRGVFEVTAVRERTDESVTVFEVISTS